MCPNYQAMLNYAMTYPGKFPPKFELSNSSHARKAEESFAMHTIVQSEWSSGTAHKVSLHISKVLAYRQNIYPRPLLSQTTSHISPVSSFLPNFIAASSLSPSRILPPGSPWSSSKTSPAVPPPATTTSPPGYVLSSLSRAMTWNEGFLPGGRFESFLPLVAP